MEVLKSECQKFSNFGKAHYHEYDDQVSTAAPSLTSTPLGGPSRHLEAHMHLHEAGKLWLPARIHSPSQASVRSEDAPLDRVCQEIAHACEESLQDEFGWVTLWEIRQYPRIRLLGITEDEALEAVRTSPVLQLSGDKKRVRVLTADVLKALVLPRSPATGSPVSRAGAEASADASPADEELTIAASIESPGVARAAKEGGGSPCMEWLTAEPLVAEECLDWLASDENLEEVDKKPATEETKPQPKPIMRSRPERKSSAQHRRRQRQHRHREGKHAHCVSIVADGDLAMSAWLRWSYDA
mmetsp:Transcript_50660/g.133809  ORF Transcript_50660/g.133809 Transcript_50660/m.133809 type:complete len:299 (-) Transcript_50660:424-1320(-)